MVVAEIISHQQWLDQTADELSLLSDTAALDARVILCHVLEKPLSYFLAWPDRSIDAADMKILNALIKRRLAGEPVAYITGSREFWSMNFKVSADVLIPRPETELLVEWAVQCINEIQKFAAKSLKLLELGTGSGAIAVALAKENPQLNIIATDISEKALAIAKENAELNLCQNITFLLGNWFEPISDKNFDMIVSNPPYVVPGDPHLKEGDLPYEPIGALVASENGLSDIQSLASSAKSHLNSGGWLGIEHGYNQAEAVTEIMTRHGYKNISTIKDLAGIDRLTICQWRNDDE